jgi:DNA polymerase III alpha subunit
MYRNVLGEKIYEVQDLCDLLYQNPELDLSRFLMEPVAESREYNRAVASHYAGFSLIKVKDPIDINLKNFDTINQRTWFMPKEYYELDIAQHLLDQCKNEDELQRVGEELLLFQERGMFNLLRYLKYMVDTLRANNIVWGVGRGSSVASFVLYLLGVHRINSIYYNLDIAEFLR